MIRALPLALLVFVAGCADRAPVVVEVGRTAVTGGFEVVVEVVNPGSETVRYEICSAGGCPCGAQVQRASGVVMPAEKERHSYFTATPDARDFCTVPVARGVQ